MDLRAHSGLNSTALNIRLDEMRGAEPSRVWMQQREIDTPRAAQRSAARDIWTDARSRAGVHCTRTLRTCSVQCRSDATAQLTERTPQRSAVQRSTSHHTSLIALSIPPNSTVAVHPRDLMSCEISYHGWKRRGEQRRADDE